MSEHTPGPWVIEAPHFKRRKIPQFESGHEYLIVAANPCKFSVATVAGPANCDKTSELAANARLIAAAPDLLAALEQIARFNKDGEKVDGIVFEMSIDDAFETINSVIGLARAAIKKLR